MQNDVKVEITCADGKVETVESHAVYVCAVTEVSSEGKDHGIACKSFFTGHVNPIFMGAPMGTSIMLVTKEMCDGDPILERIILEQAVAVLDGRLNELKGENIHGRN